MAIRTWSCERDEHDAASPFRATLLIDDQPIASGRGADEITAFGHLADILQEQGLRDGDVLGLQAMMRQWSDFKRRVR
jgi:hypothetical protein